ncbi:MAG: hypothetical protein WEB33_13170, partial [Bacteroidota bacterium]
NSPVIRQRVLEGLGFLGLEIDESLNKGMVGGKEGEIGKKGSMLIFVIPTNEELLIARDTVRSVKNAPRRW